MGALTKRIQADLVRAGIYVNVERYLLFAAVLGLPLFLLTLVLPPYIPALLYLLYLLLVFYVPHFLAVQRARRAEAEIPEVLSTVATLVDAGIDFEQALESVSGRGVLGEIISDALRIYRRGIPMENALSRASEAVLSDRVRSALTHLALLYSSGREAAALRKLAEEGIRAQEFEARRHTAELAMYTLFFIAASALVPAILSMYGVLGPLALSLERNPVDPVLQLVLFPALSAGALLLMYVRTPPFMRGSR